MKTCLVMYPFRVDALLNASLSRFSSASVTVVTNMFHQKCNFEALLQCQSWEQFPLHASITQTLWRKTSFCSTAGFFYTLPLHVWLLRELELIKNSYAFLFSNWKQTNPDLLCCSLTTNHGWSWSTGSFSFTGERLLAILHPAINCGPYIHVIIDLGLECPQNQQTKI